MAASVGEKSSTEGLNLRSLRAGLGKPGLPTDCSGIISVLTRYHGDAAFGIDPAVQTLEAEAQHRRNLLGT